VNRRIYYIDCYNGNTKEGNIGFARIDDERILVVLRGITAANGIDCPLYLEKENGGRERAAMIALRNGGGQAECRWRTMPVTRQECCALYLPLYGNLSGVCTLRERPDTRAADVSVPQPEEPEPGPRAITPFSQELETLGGDKWAQLCASYPQVHLFPEADSLVLKPRDLVVLTQEYHELATNSFVLHAYYNYRQLLLLRYRDRGQTAYYLGVPGIYYDREKRIARLFGFDAFENGESRLVNGESRRAYTGCFGYYMKRVAI